MVPIGQSQRWRVKYLCMINAKLYIWLLFMILSFHLDFCSFIFLFNTRIHNWHHLIRILPKPPKRSISVSTASVLVTHERTLTHWKLAERMKTKVSTTEKNINHKNSGSYFSHRATWVQDGGLWQLTVLRSLKSDTYALFNVTTVTDDKDTRQTADMEMYSSYRWWKVQPFSLLVSKKKYSGVGLCYSWHQQVWEYFQGFFSSIILKFVFLSIISPPPPCVDRCGEGKVMRLRLWHFPFREVKVLILWFGPYVLRSAVVVIILQAPGRH